MASILGQGLLHSFAMDITYSLRLPSIKSGLSTIPMMVERSTQLTDRRLEELRESIENNGGDAPFMLDNGIILRAAPKKKHSHRRTRQKLYAPGNKQIKSMDNLVRCPACGHVKRSHFMCMHCFGEIRTFLKAKKKEAQEFFKPPQSDLDPIDEKIVFPGKYKRDYERKLEKREWVPKREEPLLFDPKQVKSVKDN